MTTNKIYDPKYILLPEHFIDVAPQAIPEVAMRQYKARAELAVTLPLFDPMFNDFCERMARVTGRNKFTIAEAGYGMSNERIYW
jgi:hypothetical protein